MSTMAATSGDSDGGKTWRVIFWRQRTMNTNALKDLLDIGAAGPYWDAYSCTYPVDRCLGPKQRPWLHFCLYAYRHDSLYAENKGAFQKNRDWNAVETACKIDFETSFCWIFFLRSSSVALLLCGWRCWNELCLLSARCIEMSDHLWYIIYAELA